MDQKCLSCTKRTDLPEASLPLGGQVAASLLACRGVLHVSQATAATRRHSVGTYAPYRAPAPTQYLRKLRLCWNLICKGGRCCTSPSCPGLAGAFQVHAEGRRACWGSYCWGPTLAGGPRVACPRTESRSLLFLKGALPLPHRLVPEPDQVAFCSACSPGLDESHNEGASRRWTQASGGLAGDPRALQSGSHQHTHHPPPSPAQRAAPAPRPLGRSRQCRCSTPELAGEGRGAGPGRRPRGAPAPGALRPPPTPAAVHPSLSEAAARTTHWGPRVQRRGVAAPARVLGAGKDGVRSSGGPSEGWSPRDPSHHADGWRPTTRVPCSWYPILVCPFLAGLTFCVTGRKATL